LASFAGGAMAGTVVRSRVYRAGLLAAAILYPHAASAQQPPSPPSRPEISPPVPQTTAPRARLRIDENGALPRTDCPLASSSLAVDIRHVQFTGIDGAELDPGVREALSDIGAPGAQTVAVVCDIRDRANAALRRAGYIATVQIPPQTITSGELRLEVITARIVEVRIRGDAPPYRNEIAARVERLKSLDPLNERDAERILLLAGDIPGLDVQMSLLPAGTRPGEVIGELNLVYRPYSVLANVNNLGSRQLGREAAYVRAEVYGLTGAADATYLGASTTFDFQEQRVVQIGHLTGLGSGGTNLEGSFLYAWSRPDIGLLDLRSRSLIGGLSIATPLRRTRRQSIGLVGGFELIEQRTRIHSGGASAALNRDKLRVAFLRAEAGFRDYRPLGGEAWSLLGSLEIRQGLDILGATRTGSFSAGGYTPSRFSGDASALVVRAHLEGVAAIGPIFSIAAQGTGQWANHPLLNFEEFSIGNLTIGRGYDPGSNSADRAIALRGELRAKVHDDNKVRVELFGFYDSVWLWNLDPNAVENGRRLGSWGGGVRALLPGRALLEATYAHPEDPPLLRPGAHRAPDRVLLSLTFQFPPGGR